MKVVVMHQNMRIGGIQRLIADGVNEMHRRGIEVWVVFFEPEEGGSLVPTLHIPRDHIVYIPYGRMREARRFFVLVRFLYTLKPDVLFTHHWFANTVGRLAGLIAGVRVIPFEHSDYSSRYSQKQLLLDRALQSISSRIVAVSQPVRDALILRGIRGSRIVVIPNGISRERFATIQKRSHPVFTFLFIGRLIRDKCVADILYALARVPHARLVVVGSGEEEASLRSLTQTLQLTERVSFLDERPNVEDELAVVDCLVLPSRREGFGLVVVEALASGVPAIVSDTANASGAVKNGVNGFVVPSEDIDALSAAMARIASHAEEHKLLAASARDSVDQFSIERHVDRLLLLAGNRACRY